MKLKKEAMANVESIQQKAVHSVFWTIMDRFGSMAIQFIVTAILARLLEPTDFGLIGMLSLFMALGSLLIDSGFSHALIQKSEVTDKDYSTVFYVNVIIGVSLYILLYLVAPYIAVFFETPMLQPLSKVVFLMFPINALCVVHLAKLTKKLQFKTIARISIISAFISGVTGIGSTFIGLGVWALVVQQLTLYTSRLVLYWIYVRWYPTTSFSSQSFNSLWQFSANLLGAGVIVTTFDNIYVFIVGKFFPLKTTGYFNQAWQMGTLLPSLITGVVSKAMFPIFCQVKDQANQLAEISRKTLHINLFVSIPCMLGVMVMAPNIFIFFFSEKWLPSVPLFQILCIYGAFTPIRVVNTNTIKACGRGRLFLGLETIQRLLVLLSIILSVRQGVSALLWGRTVACFCALLLDMYLCGKVINFPILKQVQEQWKIGVSTFWMVLVLCSIDNFLDAPFLILPIQCVLGAVAYLVSCYILRENLAIQIYNKIKQYVSNR